jgi:hypothetical protein
MKKRLHEAWREVAIVAERRTKKKSPKARSDYGNDQQKKSGLMV